MAWWIDADNIMTVDKTQPIGKDCALASRFRSYLPVVVDVETGGLNPQTDAILQIAATLLDMDAQGRLGLGQQFSYEVQPFAGARLDPKSLKFTGIDPDDPRRQAITEKAALQDLFAQVHQHRSKYHCTRAILVGHNIAFDRDFMASAVTRCGVKKNPFHPFSFLDTVSLSALMFGQTVLVKACLAAGIDFDQEQAHSARYDCDRTARLFCHIINRWQELTDKR